MREGLLMSNWNRMFLFLLYLCLIGGGVYLGGMIILESINSSKTMNGYIAVLIGISLVHFFNMTGSVNNKLEKKVNIILAIIFPLAIWLICYLNEGNYLTATGGIIVIIACFYVYHIIYRRVQNRSS